MTIAFSHCFNPAGLQEFFEIFHLSQLKPQNKKILIYEHRKQSTAVFDTFYLFQLWFLWWFFPTELIYEEVIDWEERNKNGLMKEDCSGTHMHHPQTVPLLYFLKPHGPLFLPLSVSCLRCGVSFSFAVLFSQWHLVHVHGANFGLGHRQQQHRHTDWTTGWESVITVLHICLPTSVSPSYLQCPNIRKQSPFSLLPHPSNIKWLPFLSLLLFYFLFHFFLTFWNGSIFLFSFSVMDLTDSLTDSTLLFINAMLLNRFSLPVRSELILLHVDVV